MDSSSESNSEDTKPESGLVLYSNLSSNQSSAFLAHPIFTNLGAHQPSVSPAIDGISNFLTNSDKTKTKSKMEKSKNDQEDNIHVKKQNFIFSSHDLEESSSQSSPEREVDQLPLKYFNAASSSSKTETKQNKDKKDEEVKPIPPEQKKEKPKSLILFASWMKPPEPEEDEEEQENKDESNVSLSQLNQDLDRENDLDRDCSDTNIDDSQPKDSNETEVKDSDCESEKNKSEEVDVSKNSPENDKPQGLILFSTFFRKDTELDEEGSSKASSVDEDENSDKTAPWSEDENDKSDEDAVDNDADDIDDSHSESSNETINNKSACDKTESVLNTSTPSPKALLNSVADQDESTQKHSSDSSHVKLKDSVKHAPKRRTRNATSKGGLEKGENVKRTNSDVETGSAKKAKIDNDKAAPDGIQEDSLGMLSFFKKRIGVRNDLSGKILDQSTETNISELNKQIVNDNLTAKANPAVIDNVSSGNNEEVPASIKNTSKKGIVVRGDLSKDTANTLSDKSKSDKDTGAIAKETSTFQVPFGVRSDLTKATAKRSKPIIKDNACSTPSSSSTLTNQANIDSNKQKTTKTKSSKCEPTESQAVIKTERQEFDDIAETNSMCDISIGAGFSLASSGIDIEDSFGQTSVKVESVAALESMATVSLTPDEDHQLSHGDVYMDSEGYDDHSILPNYVEVEESPMDSIVSHEDQWGDTDVFQDCNVGDEDPDDPLAMRERGRVYRKPFTWPKLPEQFLLEAEFSLPSSFTNLLSQKKSKMIMTERGPKLVAKVKGRPRKDLNQGKPLESPQRGLSLLQTSPSKEMTPTNLQERLPFLNISKSPILPKAPLSKGRPRKSISGSTTPVAPQPPTPVSVTPLTQVSPMPPSTEVRKRLPSRTELKKISQKKDPPSTPGEEAASPATDIADRLSRSGTNVRLPEKTTLKRIPSPAKAASPASLARTSPATSVRSSPARSSPVRSIRSSTRAKANQPFPDKTLLRKLAAQNDPEPNKDSEAKDASKSDTPAATESETQSLSMTETIKARSRSRRGSTLSSTASSSPNPAVEQPKVPPLILRRKVAATEDPSLVKQPEEPAYEKRSLRKKTTPSYEETPDPPTIDPVVSERRTRIKPLKKEEGVPDTTDASSSVDVDTAPVQKIFNSVPGLPVGWTCLAEASMSKKGQKSTSITYWSPDGQKFTSKLQVLQFIKGQGINEALSDAIDDHQLMPAVTSLPEKRLKKMTPKYKAIQTINSLRKNNELMKSLNNSIDDSGHCGTCKNCLDMPKFGGPGKIRQACLSRQEFKAWEKKKEKMKSKKSSKMKFIQRQPVLNDPGHKIVCKSGNYKCPLCNTRFKLNQPYGRHVMDKECQISQKVQTNKDPVDKMPLAQAPWMLNDEDGDEAPKTEEEILEEKRRIEEIEKQFPKLFVYVHRATHKRDSWVESSHVPPLKLLARSKCPEDSKAQVPISVKEGLEFYHAFVFPNNCPEDIFFKYVKSCSKLSVCKSVKIYEKLCREPLKIAMYFERKIRTYRDLKGSNNPKTRRWVAKYNSYLQLPFHDIFLALSETKYRVIEFCKDDEVKILCLSCPSTECSGCLPAVAAVKSAVKTTKSGKLVKIPIKSKPGPIKPTLTSKNPEFVKPSLQKKDANSATESNSASPLPPPRQTVVKKIKPEKMDYALAKRSLMDDRVIRLTPANVKRRNVVEQLEASDTSPKSKRKSAMAATVALKLTSIQSGDGVEEETERKWSPSKTNPTEGVVKLKTHRTDSFNESDDRVIVKRRHDTDGSDVTESAPKKPTLMSSKKTGQSTGSGKLVFTNKEQLLNLLKKSPKSSRDEVSIDLTKPDTPRKKSVINANPSASKTANGPAGIIKCVGCLKHFTTRVDLFNHRAQCGQYKVKAEAFKKIEALKRKSVPSATATSKSEDELFQEQLKNALKQSVDHIQANKGRAVGVQPKQSSAAAAGSESTFDRLFNSGPVPSKERSVIPGGSLIQQTARPSQQKEKCIIIEDYIKIDD